jgi:hypothetical protein
VKVNFSTPILSLIAAKYDSAKFTCGIPIPSPMKKKTYLGEVTEEKRKKLPNKKNDKIKNNCKRLVVFIEKNVLKL